MKKKEVEQMIEDLKGLLTQYKTCSKLYGVIGITQCEGNIHVQDVRSLFPPDASFTTTTRDSDLYPTQITVKIDDLVIFSIYGKEVTI